MKEMVLEKILEKHVKTFLDIVVLALLNGKPMYGYRVIGAVHKEFGVLLSPGSLYPLLHFLERNGLIASSFCKGKIVYQTTHTGKVKFEKTFVAYKQSIQRMEKFIQFHGVVSH